MSNGIVKNLVVVVDVWKALPTTYKDALTVTGEAFDFFKEDQKRNLKRLSRPSLNPKNREHFVPHVLTAVISTTYQFLPVTKVLDRTFTYATIIGTLGLIIL